MHAKYCIVMLFIAALTITHCDSSMNREMQAITKNAISDAMTYKPSRCFASDKLGFECGVTIHPNSDNRPARWAYDAVSKVCIPLYMPNNYKNCTLLGNLPYTRKECETFCGEICTITYGNRKTEKGVCMNDCHIPIAEGVPLPCPPGQTRCCPRSYEFPFITNTTGGNNELTFIKQN